MERIFNGDGGGGGGGGGGGCGGGGGEHQSFSGSRGINGRPLAVDRTVLRASGGARNIAVLAIRTEQIRSTSGCRGSGVFVRDQPAWTAEERHEQEPCCCHNSTPPGGIKMGLTFGARSPECGRCRKVGCSATRGCQLSPDAIMQVWPAGGVMMIVQVAPSADTSTSSREPLEASPAA